MTSIFLSEFVGTALLILLGAGVVANTLLPKTKGVAVGANWLLITIGWAFAVFVGVWASLKSGAHINPAVTVGIMAAGRDEFAPGVEANVSNMFIYFAAQLLGAFVGAVLAWATYKQHYDQDCDPTLKLATFSTIPEIRNYFWNTFTEVVATFVLVFWVLIATEPGTPAALGPLGVSLVVLAIGVSLGGPTGYAINPARDLGPRLAHLVLPIPGKRDSDWGYSWVPIVGPLLGGLIAGLLYVVIH